MALRIGYSNSWSAAASVITAAPGTVTGLPVAASQNPDRSYPWRSTSTTGTPTLDIDLGSAVAISLAAGVNIKLVGTGVLELYSRGSAGSPGAATLQATFGAADTDTRVAAAYLAAVSARHWQYKWTNPTAALDYAELGYGFLGPYTEPTVNCNAPLPFPYDDPSVGTASVDGQQTFTQRSAFVSMDLDFDMLPTADVALLKTIYRTVGKRTPFILAIEPGTNARTYFGRFTSAFAVTDTIDSTRQNLRLSFAEAR